MLPTRKKQSVPVFNRDDAPEMDNTWLEAQSEGELLLDVYQDTDNLYVCSTIAGVKPEDLEVSIHNDMLTIRGMRKRDETTSSDDYFFQECYWGGFSRSIILPIDIKTEQISAVLRDGILTVKLPKAERRQKISINVKEYGNV